MLDYKSSLLLSTATLREAIVKIENSDGKIAIIVDKDEKLIGTITDGDIRRALIYGLAFDDSIEPIIFKNPTTAHVNERNNRKALLNLMQDLQIRQIPLLDDEGRVVGLETTINLRLEDKQENWVVLMAGGEGRRLRPLTEDTPKPMLKIGGKPILQNTIESFKKAGFHKFLISVNYKADIIKDYFKDGSALGVHIKYLEEEEYLSTAGALSLIQETMKEPFIVMNGDILTKVEFKNVIDFHQSHDAMATMCVREYNLQIPYGVVNSDDFQFESVQEKPMVTYYVNAGIYVFNPKVLNHIPSGEQLTMTDLFEQLKNTGELCCTYPVHEYWLDIGQMDDYHYAVNNYATIFK